MPKKFSGPVPKFEVDPTPIRVLKANREHDSKLNLPPWMVRADERYDKTLPRSVKDALVWGHEVPLMPHAESIYSPSPGAVQGTSGGGKCVLQASRGLPGPFPPTGASGLSVSISASGAEFATTDHLISSPS